MVDEVFTDEERARFCIDTDCKEHGDGDNECKIPKNMKDTPTSNSIAKQSVSGMTATGEVMRSDE